LTHDDIKRYATFDDVIAHFGILFERKGTGFDVPYRCLIPQEVNSLIATGRCISTDHPVQDHIRVIPKCFALGHAAGTAAALAVKAGIQPRNIDVSDLQKQLIEEDAYLGDAHG